LVACQTPHQAALERAKGDMPPALKPTNTWIAPHPRVLQLRVWIDQDYRARVLNPLARFNEQLEGANAFLIPNFGVRLVANEVHDWDRVAPAESLEAPLAELCGMSRGGNVDWTVGLVGPLPVVVYQKELLGLARYFSHCFVLRDIDGAVQHKALQRQFPDLFDDEVEALSLARRRHAEATILIHEWAHTLGAGHEVDPTGILYGELSGRERSLGPTNQVIIEMGLSHTVEGLGDEVEGLEWARSMARFLQRRPHDDLEPQHVTLLLAVAKELEKEALAGPDAGAVDAGR
jgi:hypothetical protein